MQATQLKDIPIEDVGASKNYDLVMKLLGNIVPSDGIKGATILSIQESAYCSKNDNLFRARSLLKQYHGTPRLIMSIYVSKWDHNGRVVC